VHTYTRINRRDGRRKNIKKPRSISTDEYISIVEIFRLQIFFRHCGCFPVEIIGALENMGQTVPGIPCNGISTETEHGFPLFIYRNIEIPPTYDLFFGIIRNGGIITRGKQGSSRKTGYRFTIKKGKEPVTANYSVRVGTTRKSADRRSRGS